MTHILLETNDRIATITLNRPDKLNALAGTMRQDLLAALRVARDDSSARALVITGSGRGFCSGGDVELMSHLQRENATEPFLELLGAGAEIVTTIREMPKIVIAAVNGVAAGAGCNLALACDYRIASESARFGQTFIRIGLHPDWGGTLFLPRLVGPSRAIELMATGRMIEAAEALAIGMVDQVAPAERFADEVRSFAATIAAAPPIPLGLLKNAVYRSQRNDLREQLQIEAANQLTAFQSADAAVGMAAFFEKRAPKFEGA
ncbi:MAG TPA: enoyl-CoA hydratase-related protein [Thermoanaerobaculia bacterium]|nr:enoyl-CoA hydratase-related protein [Thermoanaerobaculia bacterium]